MPQGNGSLKHEGLMRACDHARLVLDLSLTTKHENG